jgi:uncharacterized tellurite resistance protein B-like protein
MRLRVLDEPILTQAAPVRLAFLEVLHYVMLVDGVLDDREERMLDELCGRLDVRELRELLPARPEWKTAWGELLSPVRRYVLMQAAMMSWADGQVHRAERVTLERLAMALGEDPDILDEVLDWAEAGRAWAERGLMLLEREEMA